MRIPRNKAKKLATLVSFLLACTGESFAFSNPTTRNHHPWLAKAATISHQTRTSSSNAPSVTVNSPPGFGSRHHRRRSVVTSVFKREFSDLERLASQVAAASMTIFPLVLASTTAPATASTLATAVATTAVSPTTPFDPLLEAEVLTDMAHVALDLFTVFGPARLITRLAAIVGRACSMLADYIPDHKVLPEELVFQCIMMVVACIGLLQALLPMLLAAVFWPSSSAQSTMMRDGKAYSILFEPAGVSWSQFKALRALCLDWIEVGPNQNVNSNEGNDNTDDDYIYWLHKGQAVILSVDGGRVLNRVTAGSRNLPKTIESPKKARSSSHQDGVGRRLLGETRLLAPNNKVTGSSSGASSPTPTSTNNKGQSSFYDTTSPKMTIQAGPDGATFLRINPRKLHFLLDADPSLAESMRHLVLTSLHDKLMAQLLAEHDEIPVGQIDGHLQHQVQHPKQGEPLF